MSSLLSPPVVVEAEDFMSTDEDMDAPVQRKPRRPPPKGWFRTGCGKSIPRIIWDFGAPGHGKGIWDGLFGMLKQRLRTVALQAIVDDDAIHTSSKTIRDPYDCFQQLKHMFDSDEWRKAHVHRKLDKFVFFWAGPRQIWRPTNKHEHQTIKGIHTKYQYYMLRPGEVAVRQYPCWCSSCYSSLTSGDDFTESLCVPGDAHNHTPIYTFTHFYLFMFFCYRLHPIELES
jgi:hypothetical protein